MYTNEEKMKCAAREAAMRKNVYPKFIAKGTMAPDDAQREIEIMREIAADYGRCVWDGNPDVLAELKRRLGMLPPDALRAVVPELIALAREVVVTAFNSPSGFDRTPGNVA